MSFHFLPLARLRTLWGRVCSEGKAAMAEGALLEMAQTKTEVLKELVKELTETREDGQPSIRRDNAIALLEKAAKCGTLVTLLHDLKAAGTDQAKELRATVQDGLKSLKGFFEDKVPADFSCAVKMAHELWKEEPDGDNDLVLPSDPSMWTDPADESSANWFIRLGVLCFSVQLSAMSP